VPLLEPAESHLGASAEVPVEPAGPQPACPKQELKDSDVVSPHPLPEDARPEQGLPARAERGPGLRPRQTVDDEMVPALEDTHGAHRLRALHAVDRPPVQAVLAERDLEARDLGIQAVRVRNEQERGERGRKREGQAVHPPGVGRGAQISFLSGCASAAVAVARSSPEDMGDPIISRGFHGRRREGGGDRVPPGQYVTEDFPVLSAGPTPRTPLDEWDFTVVGEVDELQRWTWEEFRALPSEEITVDIHCVTKWSKLDTAWEGVPVDTLLDGVETSAEYLVAFCDGGYTTNLPVEDVLDGKAWVAFAYDGEPLDPEHGGPARLLVPHLYFWKSAKWVRALRLTATEEPGFWEVNGYHLYGDPWREQRYWGD
jgi:DMSO/TMAO reductase YedYZ molybdopterin-dependent catalytic subunit